MSPVVQNFSIFPPYVLKSLDLLLSIVHLEFNKKELIVV